MFKPFTLTVLSFFCTLYSFAIPPVVSSFSPTAAVAGMAVTITGTNFTGAFAVSFGGTAAGSFTVVSSTQINAVVGSGSSGIVSVTTADGTSTKAGFVYVLTSGIVTDYGGFWSTTGAAPNAVVPDSSHNVLAFTFNNTTYSTGVNNSLLTSKGVAYTPGSFKAFPVAGIIGVTPLTSSTYLALGKRADGSASIANAVTVSNFSIKSVLTDGINGLDLGTGVTNLPASAILSFQIFNINPAKIADDEPDILLTQIAQPVTGNDVFSFVDASGTVVGNSISQDMTLLPKLGSYDLDLFNLTPLTPYNSATAYSSYAVNTNREIRFVGFRLSDFGITTGNVSQVKALKITPSGNSDYAFIAYNANAMNLPPNVSQNDAVTNLSICSGGTANYAVLASPTSNGALSYVWEESVNGGANWSVVNNGGNYSGAATNKLSVVNPGSGYKYRVTVHENGNGNDATSTEFITSISAFTAPSLVVVSGTVSQCLNTPAQLTSVVTGGTNINYQWQTNASGAYVDIPGANLNTYTPPVNQAGIISYKLKAGSGSGCPGAVISVAPAIITITGISSATPAARCDAGALTLSAAATAGTIDWYAADAGGSSLFTGSSFNTGALAASKIYYVASSGCAALRVPVTATVYPLTAGGIISGGAIVSPGINSSNLQLNNNTGNVMKWQSSTDTFHSVINDIPNTGAALTVSNLSQSTQYRSVVQSGTCASAMSSLAYVTVSTTLALHHNSIKLNRQGTGIMIGWSAYDQQDTRQFEIEKSADGYSFIKVYTQLPVNTNAATESYNWLDAQPLDGINYYRIKELYKSGTYYMSRVVQMNFKNGAGSISVYPNPVTNHTVNLQLNNLPAGIYRANMMNSNGQSVSNLNFICNGGLQTQTIAVPGSVPAGMYKIMVTGKENYKQILSVIIL